MTCSDISLILWTCWSRYFGWFTVLEIVRHFYFEEHCWLLILFLIFWNKRRKLILKLKLSLVCWRKSFVLNWFGGRIDTGWIGTGIVHMPLKLFRFPFKSNLFCWKINTFSLVNKTRQLSSHNYPLDNKDVNDKFGITWPSFAVEDNVGKFILAIWVDCILFPFTWVTTILFCVAILYFTTFFKWK